MIRLVETNIMRGPNRWSVERERLVVAKFRFESTADAGSMRRALISWLPELGLIPENGSTSNEIPGLTRDIMVALHRQSGLQCDFAEIRSAHEPSEFFVVCEYTIGRASLQAAEATEHIINDLLNNADPKTDEHVELLSSLKRRLEMGPTSAYLLDEVRKRKIPYRQFEFGSLIALGHGNRQKKIRTAVTDHTSALGMEMAGDKDETRHILLDAGVPAPRGIIVYSEDELLRRLSEVKFPVVTKPLDGNHGRGVTTAISNAESALFGYRTARKISRAVVVEEFVEGNDYRFLVINFRLVAVALRLPAHVKGDGKSTVEELVAEENKHPQRGDSSHHVLAKIKIDAVTEKLLEAKNLTLKSVLAENEVLILKDTANISAGGTAEDVTATIHPDNRFMAERIARLFNLDICGIDLVAQRVDVPLTREVGAIIEVNAGPGLRMHSNPQSGEKRDVAGPILDMLFPSRAAALIPVVAVTGTNGKTTTTRLIAHMAKQAGHHTGYCVSGGIYINDHKTSEGDCTGPLSAQQVLFDPTIDFAVLECARGGILRAGLGFSECDVSVLTNVGNDHVGMKDVHTPDDMLEVKAVVSRSTRKEGVAILNADDRRVISLRDKLDCNVALFSLDADNMAIKEHIKLGGLAAIAEDGAVVVYSGTREVIAKMEDVPLTYGGKAQFMIANVLAATLAGVASGFDRSVIRTALQTFDPSPQHVPGRLNLFDFGKFRVLIDYVHNTDGFREIKRFIAEIHAESRTGIISIAGDRRDDDIRAVGMICATAFDRIIVRDDVDLRGRQPGEVARLIMEGIQKINPNADSRHIPAEADALKYAVDTARTNDLIFVCADKVLRTIELVEALREKMVATAA